MKSRFFRFVSLFALSILLITACKGLPSITSKSEPAPLQVAYSLWPGYFPMVIAQEKGFFTQQGVKVELLYLKNYLEPVSEFSTGKYDGIALAMSSIVNNPYGQIVLVSDRSAGADTFLANSSITTLADVKGKRVGVKLGEFGELFVLNLLEQNGLTTDDVTLVNMEGEAVPQSLKNGEIQAGHTWSPYSSQAIQAGAKVLFTSKQTPGLIPSVVLFRNNVIRDRPKQIEAFIRAWFQAQDYWKTNPEESKALIVQTLNIKAEEVSLEGIELYSLQDNLKAFTPGTTTESLYYTAKLYVDFFIRTGGISAVPDIQKLINPSFIRQLQ